MMTRGGFSRGWQSWVIGSVVFGGVLGGGGQVLAQIEPDGTLGTEIRRDVIIRDILSDRIDGGTVRGANLFHSFEHFATIPWFNEVTRGSGSAEGRS